MDQEMQRKYRAFVILANAGKLKRAQFCAELRKIASLNHLIFILDRIPNAQLLRQGLNVFIHHKECTLRALLSILPGTHYAAHQDMLSDAIIRHRDFDKGYFHLLLERVMPEVAEQLIARMGQDQKYQPLLIETLQEQCHQRFDQALAAAIIHHPLPFDQLQKLITETKRIEAKLIFTTAAVATENLEIDTLRALFREIEGDYEREVVFVNAIHPSASEAFVFLLLETEFELTRNACAVALRNGAHSLATLDYWRAQAEKLERTDAVLWLDDLLRVRYKDLSAPQLLDMLAGLRDSEHIRRNMITDVLLCNVGQLREIAGVSLP